MLPNTIVTTLTAVPEVVGDALVACGSRGRACRTSDAKTALIARSSCSFGSLGEVAAGVGLDDRLELVDELRSAAASRSVSCWRAVRRLGRLEGVVEALAARRP